MVEQAETWGRIAAANALNACAASGRKPRSASYTLQIPDEVTPSLLRAVEGGLDGVLRQRGVDIRGDGPAFLERGPAAIRTAVEVEPWARLSLLPRAGDYVMLSRPLGSDVLGEAYRRGIRTASQTRQWLAVCTRPDPPGIGPAGGREVGLLVGPGGLAETALSLALALELDVAIDAHRLPALPGVVPHIFSGLSPESVARNRSGCGRGFVVTRGVADAEARLALSAEWTGGILWTSSAPTGQVVGQLRRPRHPRPVVRLLRSFLA
ncbi:MAG: hypothetical protein ACFB9M_07190 [Myxococcota bacterium]